MATSKSWIRLDAHGKRQFTPKDFGALILSLTFIFASIALCIEAFRITPTDAQCTHHMFSWTPAFEAIKYRWFTFANNDFFTPWPYWSTGPAPDAVEEAWDKLLPKHPIAIPSFRLSSLNQTVSAPWITSPSSPDSVLALPEVFVTLGCFNFVRRWMQRDLRDYTHLPEFQGSDETVTRRAYQCLERLRYTVGCWGDSAYIFKELDEEFNTLPDMGTQHRCRNLEAIREWQEQNEVSGVEMEGLWWGGAKGVDQGVA